MGTSVVNVVLRCPAQSKMSLSVWGVSWASGSLSGNTASVCGSVSTDGVPEISTSVGGAFSIGGGFSDSLKMGTAGYDLIFSVSGAFDPEADEEEPEAPVDMTSLDVTSIGTPVEYKAISLPSTVDATVSIANLFFMPY